MPTTDLGRSIPISTIIRVACSLCSGKAIEISNSNLGKSVIQYFKGTSYLYNSTWGNSDKAIQKYCPGKCGQREFNVSLISQAKLKNNSWYHNWLKATGNRLYDLEHQIVKTDPSVYQDDYAMMEDHYHDLAHDSSVVHFYFDDLYKEKETAFETPPLMGIV